MNLDFKKFTTGTLFLVRVPEHFPVGYAEEAFKDMKRLHFDFAALLETWNCFDGVLWKSDKFPRSSYWKDEKRDPIEECFLAADKYDIAFLPEAGFIDQGFVEAHSDGMMQEFGGTKKRYGRMGLVPACPDTIKYYKAKYDALLQKFGHHKSCRGICMPAENGVYLTYDKYTKEAYFKETGTRLPAPEVIAADKELEDKVFRFLEKTFLKMYTELADYLKEKYNLPLMHYPLDKISEDSFFQPAAVLPCDNIDVMTKVESLDVLNMQIHPPLNPNPYFFKMETEFLMANCGDKPCMADTHFYHELGAGRLPDTTPKRIVDSILSTVTPYGISFFCYGFMAEKLPLWKDGIKPGTPVYRVYDHPQTVAARREMALKAMDFVEILRPLMENTYHSADCGVYYPEILNRDYVYSSYPLEHIFGLHELFNAAAIPLKFIAEIPDTAENQKLIVLDNIISMPENDKENLKKYIASGGKVMVIGRLSTDLEKILGISPQKSNASLTRSDDSWRYNNCLVRLPLTGNHYTQSGKGLMYYDNGTPAITENDNVIYIGVGDVVDRFSQYRDFYLASWLKNYCNENGLNTGVEFHNVYVGQKDRHQFVSCDIFENEDKKLLLIRNYGVEPSSSCVDWKIPKGFAITKSFTDGNEFELNEKGELPLFEHFVAIFAERR